MKHGKNFLSKYRRIYNAIQHFVSLILLDINYHKISDINDFIIRTFIKFFLTILVDIIGNSILNI